MESKINPNRIKEIYIDCLFKDDEIVNNCLLYDFSFAEGITTTAFFNTERLNSYKQEIASYIDNLPKVEQGISFFNMCMDKTGIQWTGEHAIMEHLLQLGIACEILEYPLTRDMWQILPGGMPYIIQNKSKINEVIVGHKPEELQSLIKTLSKKTN